MNLEIPHISGLVGIGTALRTCGAVVLKGGLPSETYGSAVEASRRLFGLDEAERMRWRSADPFGVGYLEYGRSRAGDTGIPNLLEAWTIDLENDAAFPTAALPDSWETLRTFGTLLRDRCRAVVAQLDSEQDGGGSLIQLLSPGLRTLLLLHYLPVSKAPEGSRRQSVHVDASIVTLLPKATTPGLTVFVDGDPLNVEIDEDDVLIMGGSALEKATAGRIQACSHTVESDLDGRDRYSSVFFGQPDARRTIVPIGSTLDWESEAVADHNRDYFARIFQDGD